MPLIEPICNDDEECRQSEAASIHGRLFSGGYERGYSKRSYYSITAFNIVLALFLILCSIPFMITIGLIIRLRSKGPILYQGVRLGLGMKPFMMYKFRTLPVGAQSKIGSRLFSHHHYKLDGFSRFLRDTRLDELPQLFNILKGDMDFIGPRPERPEIYQALCKDIPNYDRRFWVRPGLIGFSQLFTPHSTPKKLRTLIDNRYLAIERSLPSDILIIFYTVVKVLKAIAVKGIHALWLSVVVRAVQRTAERRALTRVKQKSADVVILSEGDSPTRHVEPCRLVDINEGYLRIHSNFVLDGQELEFIMVRYIWRKQLKRKTALCRGKIHRRFPLINAEHRFGYVLEYTPVSALNRYLVDQYFLKKSMAQFSDAQGKARC